MSKNVLIISSSPRKGGNSDVLCDQFTKGAAESGNSVEKIFLKEKKIAYCNGCGACFSGDKCPLKDDADEIVEKMIAADVIVMATPVYFYTMCAQMKTLIDRTCARYMDIADKEFYFIMTAADPERLSLTRTLECFRGFTACLPGAEEKGVVYGTGVTNIGEVENTKAMYQAYEMGKTIN